LLVEFDENSTGIQVLKKERVLQNFEWRGKDLGIVALCERYKSFLLFILLLCVFLLNGRSLYFRDPGTFFHTRVGEIILEEAEFPESDRFTFTFDGKPWIAHQWLGQVTMGLLFRMGGFDLTLLFFCMFLALVFAWLSNQMWRSGMNNLFVALSLVFTLICSTHSFLLRPHLFTVGAMLVVFSLLLRIENEPSRFRQILRLPFIVLLWANIHGGVIGGIGTIGFVMIGWCVFFIAGKESPVTDYKKVTMVILVFFLCCFATLVNPYETELIRFWRTILSTPAVAEYIQEHAPIYKVSFGWVVVLWGIFYATALVGTWRGGAKQRVVWYLPVVWLVLAFGRIRHAPIFAVVAALTLSDFWLEVNWFKVLREKGSVLFKPLSYSGQSFWKPVLISICFICSLAVLIQNTLNSRMALVHYDDSYWPYSHIKELRTFAEKEGPEARIMNEMLFGGFIAFYIPQLQFFMDDRCELAEESGLQAYVDILNDNSLLEQYENKYGFRGALTIPGSPFDAFFKCNDRWEAVKTTKAAVFYIKKS